MIDAKFEDLKGKIISNISVDKNKNEIYFSTNDLRKFKMYHEQDCCESVTIEDICGIPLNEHVGHQILVAEVRTNEGEIEDSWETFTWTFYELATIKGNTTIRWYGTSNGYYSERVNFEEVENI